EIAMKTIGRPLGNTALIGAFAAATGEIKLETLLEVIKKRFSGKAQEGNIQAATQGFEYVNKNK
ncbi:MAG: 2-oxoacid:acceptor oxidoreductase family protein, partial [Candidatus Omnitrophota bacterium]